MTLKEAKEILKDEEYLNCLSDRMTIGEVTQFEKAIDTVLKALEEQQKEIKELATIKYGIEVLESSHAQDETYYVIAKKKFLIGNYKHLLDNYVSKEKIREKIKELGKDIPMMTPGYFDWDSSEVIKLLEELLGEE